MGKLTNGEIVFLKNHLGEIKKDGEVICTNYIFEALQKIDIEVLNIENSNLFKEK